MDELAELIAQLKSEVSGLEHALRQRDADEEARLRLEEGRLRVADARLARAAAQLERESSSLVRLEQQRAQLRARTEGWRGQLWRMGHGSAVALTVPMVVTSVALTSVWFGGSWAVGLLVGQAALFGALYALIPGKR